MIKGIDYICHQVDKLILETKNKYHVAYSLQEKYHNLDVLFYNSLNLNTLYQTLEKWIMQKQLQFNLVEYWIGYNCLRQRV